MEVKIEVSDRSDELTQADSQRIKRAANMLRDAGFKVEITWGKKEEPVSVL